MDPDAPDLTRSMGFNCILHVIQDLIKFPTNLSSLEQIFP